MEGVVVSKDDLNIYCFFYELRFSCHLLKMELCSTSSKIRETLFYMKHIFLVVVLVAACLADSVNLDFFFEAQCPGCKIMYGECLYPLMKHQDLADKIKFGIFPFGNGHIISRDPPKFTCQHGEEECYLNMVETCVVAKYEQPKTLEFLKCLEATTDMRKNINKCAEAAGVSNTTIYECVEGPEGPKLLLEVAEATPKDHKYVPWLTIDGVSQMDKEYSVVETICSKLSDPKPESCTSFSCKNLESKKIMPEYKPEEHFFRKHKHHKKSPKQLEKKIKKLQRDYERIRGEKKE